MAELVGQRFGRLVVIGEPVRNGNLQRIMVRCDCGREDRVVPRYLRSAMTTQCRVCSQRAANERKRLKRAGRAAIRPVYRLEVGARLGSLTLTKIDRCRAWAVCDCGRPWRGHRTQWTPQLRCDGPEHGLLAQWRAQNAMTQAVELVVALPPAATVHAAPAEHASASDSRRATASRRAKQTWASAGTRADRLRALAAQRVERLQKLVGKRFQHIEVVGFDADERTVVIRCDCGTVKEKPASQWRQSRSCGCLQRDRTSSYGVQSVRPPTRVVETWRTEGLARAIANVASAQHIDATPAPQPTAPSPKPLDLTVQQRAVLLAVQRAIDTRGYPPSMTEIAEAVQSDEHPFVPVADCLRRLEVKGYIARSQVSARGLKVLRRVGDKARA